MGNYYYISDKDSDLEFTPVPEDEYVQAIFRIAKRQGVQITDEIILKEVENIGKENLKKIKTKVYD